MTGWSVADLARSLFWIFDAQSHVNSCADEIDDPEALQAVVELQHWIDREWDRLGPLAAGRKRPYSILRPHDAVQSDAECVESGSEKSPSRISNAGA